MPAPVIYRHRRTPIAFVQYFVTVRLHDSLRRCYDAVHIARYFSIAFYSTPRLADPHDDRMLLFIGVRLYVSAWREIIPLCDWVVGEASTPRFPQPRLAVHL